MISSARALELIMEINFCQKTEEVNLLHSIGRCLAEDVHADRDFPPFDRVCMDGIAIDYQSYIEGKRYFPRQDLAAAGMPQVTLLDSNHCLEVMTGSILPKACNTVIRYEDLRESKEGFKIIKDGINPEQNIHFRGEDCSAGTLLLSKGHKIKSSDINLLATVGAKRVKVYRLPRICVLSTGEELVTIDEEPLAHQIRRSNVYMLQARLLEMGFPSAAAHLPDDKEKIRVSLTQLFQDYDVLLLSGGVSKGKFDFIPVVLEELGVKKKFHFVAQRPGKPFWAGTHEAGVVFAFPGNPVSTLACFEFYCAPWLRRLQGKQNLDLFSLRAANSLSFTPKLDYFALARLKYGEEELLAEVFKGNGSGDILSPTSMDGFLLLRAEESGFQAGNQYRFIPIH